MNRKSSVAAIVAAAAGLLIGAGLPRTQADAPKASGMAAVNTVLARRLDVLEKRVQQLELNQTKSNVTTFTPNPGNAFGPQSGAIAPEWRVVPLNKSDEAGK